MFDRMNPSVVITEPMRRYNKYLMSLEAECISDTAECPKRNEKVVMGRDGPRAHSAVKIKDDFTTFQVRDMYDTTEKIVPCLITYRVQMWKCSTCKQRFSDPETQYRSNWKTSKSFDMYLAQTFLSDVKLDTAHLANGFLLSKSKVRDILHKYRLVYEKLYVFTPPCTKMWVIEFDFDYEPYFIVFGELKQNGKLAILGICEDNSMETVNNKFGLSEGINTPEIMFVPEEHYCAAFRCGCKIKKIEDGSVVLPDEIGDVIGLIEDFEARNYSFSMMKLRMEFCDEFRRNLVRQIGIGTYLKSKMSRETTAFLLYSETGFRLCDDTYDGNDVCVPIASLDPETRECLMGKYREWPLEIECNYIDAEALVTRYKEELVDYEPFWGDPEGEY